MDRIIILDERQLDELKAEIAEAVVEGIQSLTEKLNDNETGTVWVDGEEASRILGYRSKTKMQELRNKRAIVYSKFGRKIRYNRQSLLDYMLIRYCTSNYQISL